MDTVELDLLDDVLVDEAAVVEETLELVDDDVENLEVELEVLEDVLLDTLVVSDVDEVALVGVETDKLDVLLVLTDVEEAVGFEEALEVYDLE